MLKPRRRLPRIECPRNALTDVLWTVLLTLVLVLLLGIGDAIDRAAEAEDALHAARNHALDAARAAYLEGLDQGCERELFQEQRRLAALEGDAP
jgi:hypothetical protein